MIKKTVAVIGGDERAVYAARFLADKGAKIALYGLEEHFMGNCAEFEKGECKAPYLIDEAVERAEILLLPIPFSKDQTTVYTPFSKDRLLIEHLAKTLQNSQKSLILAGGGLARYRFSGHTVFDLLTNEDFLFQNARPSAESALGLAILHHRSVLQNCPVAVFGFGRIASLLCQMLQAIGADVTVFARREEQRKKAEKLLLKAENLTDFPLFSEKFRIFFNTVPAEIISTETARKMPHGSLYIELASAPYGMGEQAKKCYPGDHLPAPGLPGRYAPEYAGKVIAELIERAVR